MEKARKKYFIFLYCIVIFTLLFSLTACGKKPDPREAEIVQLVSAGAYNEAIKRANNLYEGKERDEMIYWIKKSMPESMKDQTENQNQVKKLEIQPNHSHKIKGDYYYITGRVKNVSNSNISYFEVRCDFLDSDNQVLDSDYTNDRLTLKPGEMREFEIMHKYNSEYKNYKLSIGSVK